MQTLPSAGKLLSAVKSLFSGPARAPLAEPQAAATAQAPEIRHRRFLSDNPVLYEQAIAAAESYVSKMPASGREWLRSKPYDRQPGHAGYFRLMYDLLNVLQAMLVSPNARVLEVGCGPGWVTEVLLMLGHEVDALEPSADMIAVARQRCDALEAHHGFNARDRVRFHKGTLEEIEFEPDSFDAVLYFDVLHHVVDERVAIDKTFRFLRPGGCVGIVESAWHPDFKDLEAGLVKEMEEFGTLENPFSTAYLDELLTRAGFVGIERRVAVNGFFGAEQLRQPLANFGAPLSGVNNVLARKPVPAGYVHSCDQLSMRTDVRFELRAGALDPDTRTAGLTVSITNCGETLMDNRTTARAPVTLALRRGVPGGSHFMEAKQRHFLATALKPGESVTMALQFTLPEDAPTDGWELDAIAEGSYWFSNRGIAGLPVPAARA